MKNKASRPRSTGSVGANTLDVIAGSGPIEGSISESSQVGRCCSSACSSGRLRRHAQRTAARALPRARIERLPTRVLWAASPWRPSPLTNRRYGDGAHRPAQKDCRRHAAARRRKNAAATRRTLVGGSCSCRRSTRREQAYAHDSEHSAIFQSLPEDPRTWDARVEKITHRFGRAVPHHDLAALRDVSRPACAIQMVMGRKISVDSATM